MGQVGKIDIFPHFDCASVKKKKKRHTEKLIAVLMGS